MSPSVLQSLLLVGAAGVLFSIVVALGRRGALSARFVVGWAAIAALLGLSGPVAVALWPFASWFGITPTGLLLGLLGTVTVAIALQLSIASSRQRRDLLKLAEEIARLRHTVEHAGLIRGIRQPSGPGSSAHPVVIVPAYNEEQSVGQVVAGLVSRGLPVVVVDDGSTDRTSERAADAGATVLRLPINGGVGAAVGAGLRFATSSGHSMVVQCDADGQHPPSEVEAILRAAEILQADLIIGSRFAEGGAYGCEVSGTRKIAMKLLAASVSAGSGQKIHDTTSGLRVFREPLLSACQTDFPVHYLGDTYEFLRAACLAGYRVVEVPVRMEPRSAGTASAGSRQSAMFFMRVALNFVLRVRPSIATAEDTSPGHVRRALLDRREMADIAVAPDGRQRGEHCSDVSAQSAVHD